MGATLSTLGLALLLAAQAEQPAQRFKSSVDVVQVDVNAVDAEGRPIRDLKVEDFELRVDGRRRAIVSTQFISVPADASAPAAAVPPYYSSNADQGGGRLIMVVVDRMSIGSGRGKAALEAAGRFVAQLNRADRVALASIPDGPQVNFTADHALVRRLLQQVDGTAPAIVGMRSIGIADALGFERKDQTVMQEVMERECGVPNVGALERGGGQSEVMICQNEVLAESRVVAADARDRARSSVQGLEALIGGFPPSQTPKLLVYISEGLVLDREFAQLSWLDAKAAAAHVTIYPLHLEMSDMDASRRRPQARAAADRTIQEHGLSIMAQATGGEVFRVISNSDFAFSRLSNELSGYYLLAFEPEARDRNGKPHTIGVSVKRSGVTVRSRRQFTIGAPAPKTADSEVVAALRDPLPATEIPVKVTTYTFRDPHHDKLRLLVAAEIDRSINPTGDVSVGYVVVDFNGQLVTSQLDLTLPTSSRRTDRSARYFSTVPVDPGKYTLKLAVVDDAGRRGSVERVVEAGLATAGPVHVTDLLLGDAAARAGELTPAPAVTGDIGGPRLYGYLELFADAPETLEQASITLEIAQTETGAALERAPVELTMPKENTRCRIAGVGVEVSRLPPGDYVARAVIAIGLDSVGQVSRPFRITPSGGSPASRAPSTPW